MGFRRVDFLQWVNRARRELELQRSAFRQWISWVRMIEPPAWGYRAVWSGINWTGPRSRSGPEWFYRRDVGTLAGGIRDRGVLDLPGLYPRTGLKMSHQTWGVMSADARPDVLKPPSDVEKRDAVEVLQPQSPGQSGARARATRRSYEPRRRQILWMRAKEEEPSELREIWISVY